MNNYKKYKPSGIDWIGEVPEHWNIIRVKGNCYVKGRIGWQELRADEFLDEGIHCVTGTDFINQFVNWDTCYRVSIDRYLLDDNIQLKEGDVLITKDGTIGKTAIVKNLPEKATLNSGIFLVRPEKVKLENKYLYWILNSKVFEDYNDYTKTGATIQHLYQNVFVEMHFPLPENGEQLTIANYLDHQTQKIDRLIANKKAQAEKLKELRRIDINNAVTKGLSPKVEMKDSGIEWLGKIPKHWAEKRLKNLVSPKITDGPHETPELVDDLDGIPFISAEAITENGINYEARGGNISVEQDRIYSLKCKPKRDDIFMVKSGSTTGRIGYVDTDLNFNIWSPLALIRANSNTHSRFLYFALCSNYIQKQVQLTWSFGTQPNIGMGVIERLRLVVPPKDEQVKIANYLQQRTASLDQLLRNIELQIEKLQELRKITIYKAVTGKIKINAYAETAA